MSETQSKTAPESGSWGSMNAIQRSGVIAFAVCFVLSLFCDGRVAMVFGLVGWSSILMGYVAGNLWRVRHAVHFWWSVAFACVVHAALLPVYAGLVDQMKNAPGHAGKGYMYLGFGLMIAETLSLIFFLKWVAMWMHKRAHKNSAADGESRFANGR